MNFSSVSKFKRFMSRVAASNISTKLGLSFRSGRKEKADVELQSVDSSRRQQQRHNPSSRDTVISVIEVSRETIEVKVGNPPVRSRLSSSESDSIEEALRPPGETRGAARRPITTEPPPSHQSQQFPRQEDLDEIVSLPNEGDDEQPEVSGFVLKQLGKQETASSVRRRKPEHVSIEMGSVEAEDVTDDVEKNPTYVETYMNIMFTCSLSPFLPEGASGGFWSYCQAFCFIQVIVYWVMTIASLLEAFANAKLESIEFLVFHGDLEDFTNTTYQIMNVVVRIYSAYLFTLQQQKFAKMLKSMGRLRKFANKYCSVREEKYQSTKVIILALISMTLSTLSVVFASGIIGWTPDNGVLFFSNKLAVAMYIWTPQTYSSSTAGVDAILEAYGCNLTTEKVFMGLLFGGMRLCSRALTNAVGDLILTASLTVEKQMARLAKDVGNPENDISPVTLENFEVEGGQWEHYELLKEAVDDTNDVFDTLLKYVHVDNVMLFVYIVMNAFDGDLAIFAIIYMLYNIGKASITYGIAAKASSNNSVYRRWIRRLIRKSSDPMFISKAYAILDQMKEEPMGLGKGQFMIDETFLFRFLGGVGSVFVVQAQTRENMPPQ